MTWVQIVRAGRGDVRTVAELLAAAFEPLEVAAWMVPVPADRLRVLAANFEIFVEHAYRHGRVHVTVDRRAAAVWVDRTEGEPPLPEDLAVRLGEACGPYARRALALGEELHAHQPVGPHYHLAFLGVLPPYQGKGLGAALLRYHHAALDLLGADAYLEASSERAAALYERYGYERGKPFYLPQDGPPFIPMTRRARSGRFPSSG